MIRKMYIVQVFLQGKQKNYACLQTIWNSCTVSKKGIVLTYIQYTNSSFDFFKGTYVYTYMNRYVHTFEIYVSKSYLCGDQRSEATNRRIREFHPTILCPVRKTK
jgi:hypothetical protein